MIAVGAKASWLLAPDYNQHLNTRVFLSAPWKVATPPTSLAGYDQQLDDKNIRVQPSGSSPKYAKNNGSSTFINLSTSIPSYWRQKASIVLLVATSPPINNQLGFVTQGFPTASTAHGGSWHQRATDQGTRSHTPELPCASRKPRAPRPCSSPSPLSRCEMAGSRVSLTTNSWWLASEERFFVDH